MVARKGQPNLVNDPVYRPDWKERVTQQVITKKSERWNLRSSEDFIILLRKAAASRGMNNAAYARRAIAAFIAADLQMPFEDVCNTCPTPGQQERARRGFVWPRDDGQGYGEWEVKH
jgi:hypothetical protein